jgi:hypothetical protein
MDISSLGVAYLYVVKIEKNIKQKMRQFGSTLIAKAGQGQPQPTKKRA